MSLRAVWPAMQIPSTILALAAFGLLFMMIVAGSGVNIFLPSCPGELKLLVYPRYNKRGLVESETYRCGAPTRYCTARAGSPAVFDCLALTLKL